ncbi:MAG: hypothetical protein QXI61_06470 [Nitrososphaerota archaeon]
MSEQINYLDKFLEAKFSHIDSSIQNISNAVNNLSSQFSDLKNQFSNLQRKVEEDNKSTRHWILGSAITFFIGFIAAAIAIFFGFAQLQTSWIQTAMSFVSKIVVK